MRDSTPVTVLLDVELRAIQNEWRNASLKDVDRLYIDRFAPAFVPSFSRLPMHGAPQELERPEVLISVLGFSWQPVALMAAWVQPRYMLLLATEESRAKTYAGENAESLIVRLGGVDSRALEVRVIAEDDEAEVYLEVRNFLLRKRMSDERARLVLVDPTGGKKSMSAAAAMAGFLSGAQLGYVDYGEYDSVRRVPVAGTEYPRLLKNPLQVFGDVEYERVRAAFNRGDFLEAEHLAELLASRLYEPREAEALGALAAGYGAWDNVQFHQAREYLDRAASILRQHGRLGSWSWLSAIESCLESHATLLRNLAAIADAAKAGEPPDVLERWLSIVWDHLARARRAIATGRTSVAVLLTYAAVERYVNLHLRIGFGLDDERPDYALLDGTLDLRRYHDTGRSWHGGEYEERPLRGPLMYAVGIQLLASLRPDLVDSSAVRRLKHLAVVRNRCEFEHGIVAVPADTKAAAGFIEFVAVMVAKSVPGVDAAKEVEAYQFPMLPRIR